MRYAAMGAVGALALGACGAGDSADPVDAADDVTFGEAEEEDSPGGVVEGVVPAPEGSAPDIDAVLVNAAGEEVGSVALTSTGDATEVRVTVRDLPPGFHGMHVHAEPACEPDSPDPVTGEVGDFRSASGHVGWEETDHGTHPGDLPPLYVGAAGSGELLVETPAFSVDDIEELGGAALIVHSEPDNFANIPERYAPDGPDEETLLTGDSGERIACAVLRE